MRIRLLPSSFESDGSASERQHTCCLLLNDRVAIDAGSLAQAASEELFNELRDVVLTHAHLDHIAGLPLFIDDLFAVLREPVRIHASQAVIEVLERDIFNWSVYPRFSELENSFGKVIEYIELEPDKTVSIGGFDFRPVEVNHNVPSTGFIVSDRSATIALTGDTSETDGFWNTVKSLEKLDALFVECAFPDSMSELAEISHHLTPQKLRSELSVLDLNDIAIYVINIKPRFRDVVVKEIEQLEIRNLQIMPVGREIVV